MDLSAFSSDSFDPKEWINAAFRSSEARANKEAYAAEVAFKLQLFIQEMNSALEETAQQVQQNLPKVLRDVEAMQQEAAGLKQHMSLVQKDIEKVEHDSSKSIRTLLNMDAIKFRMLDASQALREADNWTTLSSDVDQVFQSGDAEAITSRLVGMQSSLDILIDVADYEARSQRLEALKNRLEATLSPYLVQAFTSHSVDAAKKYVRIFSDIRRSPQLVKYYHSCQKSALLEAWRKILDNEDTFMERLNNLYDVLLSTWHAQCAWCTGVFPEPPAPFLVADVLADVLSGLETGLSLRLDAAMKQRDAPTAYLADVVRNTERLAKGLEASGIRRECVESPHFISLLKALYSFCGTHLENYGNLEKQQLISQLPSFEADLLADCVASLADSVSRAFALLREAEARCGALLHGCCYPQLIGAAEAFFRAYGERCLGVLRRVESVPRGRGEDGWPSFQCALGAARACGEMALQLDALQRDLLCNVRRALKHLGLKGATLGEAGDFTNRSPSLDCALTTGLRRDLRDLSSRPEGSAVLPEAEATVRDLCTGFCECAFETALSEIRSHLSGLEAWPVWTQESPGGAVVTKNLPPFSLSPLEYITRVGQYLLTVPQHVEPFVAEDDRALAVALRGGDVGGHSEGSDPVVDRFLGRVARATTEAYVEAILRVERLTPRASVQLATDVGYLCNVLDDLGLPPVDDLRHLSALLRCSAQDFATVSRDVPSKWVRAVGAVRGIVH